MLTKESLCEKYIPKLDENIRKNAKWMTVKIKQDINRKHKVWYKMRSSRSKEARNEYKKY